MSQYDQGWAQINRPVFRKSFADKVHMWLLGWVIAAYKFERAIAKNPRVIHGLSQSITRLESDLARLQVQ
jgi:hypothetical protein